MERVFVDTNYLLRFLLRDVESQFQKAQELFLKGARNEVHIITSVLVIFELVWILSHFYNKSKEDNIVLLGKILQMDYIRFDERLLVFEALVLYKKLSLELEDCYHLVCAKELDVDMLATFDKKLQRAFKRYEEK